MINELHPHFVVVIKVEFHIINLHILIVIGKTTFNIFNNCVFIQIPLLHVIFLYFLLIDHQLCLHEHMIHFHNFKLCHPIMVDFHNLYSHCEGPTLMFHYIIYLWKNVVCLFCFVCTNEIHWTRMLQIVFFNFFGKLSTRRGASPWFHGVWTCGAKIIEY